MTDSHLPYEKRLDRELGFKSIIVFGVGILLLTALAGGVAWLLSDKLRTWVEAKDPPPPALLEARFPQTPPEPRLQAQPIREFQSFRAEQEAILTGYAWVDEANGVVSVPIETAMELVLAGGLPEPGAAEAAQGETDGAEVAAE